ncbi:hypothetical protein ACWKWU_19245 [Chitinophaga lutea]
MQRLYLIVCLAMWALASCKTTQRLPLPPRLPVSMGGEAYYRQTGSMPWNLREPVALQEVLSGNIPAFLRKLQPIHVSVTNTAGRTISATYFVTKDYLSIGADDDFARIPLTPQTAQRIADSLHCILPTRKMVDDIYRHAAVKLEPVPLFAFRDSAIVFWHHHLIIEGQRKGRQGLIAGIKKDVVTGSKMKAGKVVIYGWHKPDGKPIQPLYAGHVDWYVDYSHGIRLVSRRMKVDGKWMDYAEVLQHPQYQRLFCDEDSCSVFRYGY